MYLQVAHIRYFYRMHIRLVFLLCLFAITGAKAQISSDSAAFFIRQIYRQAYTDPKAYDWLRTLTKDVGHRLSGSPGAAKAVAWAKTTLDTFGLDSVWLQPVMVPHWVRGDKELVLMLSPEVGALQLEALALGHSPGTGVSGIRAQVIEVLSLDELRAIPDDSVKGKIVFFNRPMDLGLTSTFSAYGRAVDQRGAGPVVAAEKGAVAAVVRSMSTRLDQFPHTGVTRLSETVENIPSVAISTMAADRLSQAISKGPVELFIRTTCEMLEDAPSHNVIGEIRGSTYPDEIILVGGHLDSWDVGEGAHDDGAGCVHAMEVIFRLRQAGYVPLRTIRCVLFMNEENGTRGGLGYAEKAFANGEYHLAAIESDAGGTTPQAFGCSAGEGVMLDSVMAHMSTYFNLLEPYDIELQPGGGGVDINPLKPKAGILVGLRPDNARYFDYHHAASDVLENVHPRELATGAAAMTALVFLIDQYGIGR